LTFWRAGIYFTHAWGVSTCSAVYNSFSLVVYDSHTGKERVSWPAGAGDSVSLLFELWAGNNNRRRRASEKESLIVGYTKILGTGSCFCSFRYFVSLVNFFLSLPIFSSYAGPFDHAGVEFGSTEKYKLFLLLQFGLLPSDVHELSEPKQCTCTALGPCIVMSKHSTQPLTRLMLNETEAWLAGCYIVGWQVGFLSARVVETR